MYVRQGEYGLDPRSPYPDPDCLQNFTGTSLSTDTSVMKLSLNNPITVSGDISQIIF